jgi:sialic acid synthase SpsE
MNLRTIPYLAERFGVVAGLSDHTLGIDMPIAAVALGARVIEKHLCLSRALGGPDASFSMEPDEFASMVRSVRNVEQGLGTISFELTEKQMASAVFRRSLFAAQDIKAGETLTPDNVRSVRPGHGLHPKHFDDIIGQTAKAAIRKGTPLSWELIN